MTRQPNPPPPEDGRVGGRRRGGLGEARTYRPRGRTVRETPVRAGRGDAGRGGDPFRPASRGPAPDQPRPKPSTDRQPAGGRTPGRRPTDRESPAAEQSQAKRPTPPQSSGKRQAAQSSGTRAAPQSPGRRPAGQSSGPRQSAARQPERPDRRRAKRQPAGAGRPAAKRAPKPPRLADPVRRIRLATVLALTLFAVIGVRLIELQLTEGPAYAASGLENRLQTVALPAPRGTIFDRGGGVLAHSVEARSIFADPELVTDPERVAAELQPLLGVPASQLLARMQPRVRDDGTVSRFEWLARRVDVATADAVMALNLQGIAAMRDERRVVPGHDLAANVIGFTGEDLTGLEGIESSFDDTLRGVDGKRTFESGLGREIPGGYLVETPAEHGSDLRLTIDMDLQYEVQRMLADHLRRGGASFGAAVVIDAHNGEVLALSSYPTYDAADPLGTGESDRVDVATARVVDPGSSHKPFVFGAALEEGLLDPTEILTVGPTIQRGDVTFRDHGRSFPEGTEITLPAAMAFSSNVATIQVADRLGKETLYEYQRAFGLGAPTGIGLPGEAGGALLPPDEWYGSSHGSVPIGHSVDVTPLQMAAGYAAIANDGTWIQPQLVQAVIGPDGTESRPDPPTSRQVMSPENAAALREIMEAVVVVDGATGTNAAVDRHRVAGKTGTGRLIVDGRYAAGEVSSFIGMAPAEAPRFVVAVFAHTDGGGAALVNPAFREMMSFTMKHYRVPPSATDPPTFDLHP